MVLEGGCSRAYMGGQLLWSLKEAVAEPTWVGNCYGP